MKYKGAKRIQKSGRSVKSDLKALRGVKGDLE